jgi:hypothetical protein
MAFGSRRFQEKDLVQLAKISDVRPHASADVDRVPTISAFYGIAIRMYADDHLPPHFHAKYAEHRAVVDINRCVVIRGWLPKTAERLVVG